MPPNPPLALRDIHLPEAIGWWPPALGWWLAALGIIFILVLTIWLYRRWRKQTPVKLARRELIMINQNTVGDDLRLLMELSALLRRVAISLHPRLDSASLTGDDWMAFLDRSLKDAPFSQGLGNLLKDAQYRATAPDNLDRAALLSLCERWLEAQRKHLSAKRS